ncbi:MAG: thiamine pyrophosphate-binding protein [Thermoproteota archaeon]|nr:thiamine pyrophosphate-binding protein [Thermoproteota archaeon]
MLTADIVAETLIDWGVTVMFGMPGDGINGFMEALRKRQDKIRFVLVRHEESAAFMACAYAKYTGKLGACVATSGPGAIHLLNGLYDAKLDNTPVIAITGRTYSDLMGSGYQQDVNQLQLFADVSVYNNMIIAPEQAEMAVDIACRTALSQKGVSHITIPIDIQEKKLEGKYSKHKVPGHTSDVFADMGITPTSELIQKAADIINSGDKVVILIGQGGLNATDNVTALSEKVHAPIVKALLGKATVADDHPNCLGGIGMLGTTPSLEAMEEADTILMIGTSFPYIEYLPSPGQARGIQIDIKPERIGLRYPIEVGLTGDSNKILSILLPFLKQKSDHTIAFDFLHSKQESMRRWNELLAKQSNITYSESNVKKSDEPGSQLDLEIRNSQPEYQTVRNNKDKTTVGLNDTRDDVIKPQSIAAAVSRYLNKNAIISVDSGTNTIFASRFINIQKGMKFSLSGTLASMACGLPYAIAAKIAYPQRQSIAFVGDGGFSMLMGEFATAVQHKLPIIVIILKNNVLGMIRWEQMAFLGNPEFGIEFSPIDFAKFAESCGGIGYTIKKPEEIDSIMKLALVEQKENTRPILVEAYVDAYEPPMPPRIEPEFVKNIAESFLKGQPHKERIGLTLFRNQLNNSLESIKDKML